MNNPILPIDGYKTGHIHQYPEGITNVYSNFTARMSRVDGQTEVVFLGLQMFIQKYLMEDMEAFFAADVEHVVDAYQHRMDTYLGPDNGVGTEHIRALHNLGYIPLRFCAVPEGTLVPLRVPMLTVENTHPDFAWLVNYFETVISNSIWMPITSATTAFRFRKLIQEWARKTGSDEGFVNFQAHDFSMRGMAGVEAAQQSGIGHLASFIGTDTIPAIEAIENYYPPKDVDFLIGASVPATEHSVMCAGGKENEIDTYVRLLNLYPAGIVSIVSDTWDYWKVLTETLPKMREQIMAREGRLVVRPDSGDPVKVIIGDPDAPIGSPEYKGTVEVLWDEFGGTITDRGYKTIDTHVGVIYGDSINYERAQQILSGLAAKGFSVLVRSLTSTRLVTPTAWR
jgi:nicotinamide phosphoribosyltransferase